VVLSKYCKIFPYKKNPDTYILISKSALDDIGKDSLSYEEKETLIKLGFLVQDEETEKQEMLNFFNELNAVNRKFKAIVVLNLDCNLACKYCFEGSRKGKFYMTKVTADLFIEFVKRKLNLYKSHISENKNLPYPLFTKEGDQYQNSLNAAHISPALAKIPLKSPPLQKGGEGGFDEIKIIFYGGEPLLSTELIVYILERLKSLAEVSGKRYSFSLITNGTLLTTDVIKEMMPFGLTSADITLDGPKNIHDIFRPFKSGKGTFDLIVRNIKDVCDMINVQIGGNFTKENYKEFPRLLDYLIDNGLTPDKISSVNFDPVIKETPEFALPDFTGGCVSINEPWLFDAGIFLSETNLRKGFQTQKIMPAACMIEIEDSLVINYNGSIYKCPGFLGRERFCVGDLKNGIHEYRQSHNLNNWKNDECLNCSYLPLCFGGCRYMKFLRDGDMNGVDCKKSFLDASLEQLVTNEFISNVS
jgi:uncharacterized protein